MTYRTLPARVRILRVAAVIATTVMGLACNSPNGPSRDAVATLDVLGETFRIRLASEELIGAAEAAKAGTGPSIPNGRIVAGTQVNTGWSWHLEDVMFVEATIEVCDGRPSDVERQGVAFGGGRFCPWTAEVVSIDR